MKLLFDFFPIILFFVSYYQAQFLIDNTFISRLLDPSLPSEVLAVIVATGIALVANFIQVSYSWLKHKRVEKMHLFSFALFLVLGGATILLADPDFLKWKPTVLNWLFGAVFFASQFIGDNPLIKRIMGGQISLPEFVWSRLNLAWVMFFFVSGAANLYVAFYYGLDLDHQTRMDHWVNFKLFGLMGLTLVFVVLQAVYLARHIHDEDAGQENAGNRE